MSVLIEPRLLKGFRDTLPEAEVPRRRMVAVLAQTFERFGFLPIDTPALEYADVLLGKGGGETDKQVYRFLDHGGRDVAMRFDLTVPFARYMATHRSDLYLPFKRYHVAKVWRGENTQRGRFREFYQCDFDTVGVDSASADLEILLLMGASMSAVGIDSFRIHLSHRGVFTTLLEKLGVADRAEQVLRTVDKQGKIGPEKVAELLREIVGPQATSRIVAFAAPGADFEDTLQRMRDAVGGETEHTARLAMIRKCLTELGLGDLYHLDPSITRGLDYYTGIVFETFLAELPEIGSVCSGGRYNNLTSIYSREAMPGVGASIGLDRLLAALEEMGQKNELAGSPDVLVLCLDEDLMPTLHRLAASLRVGGLSAEVYPEKTKLPRQFQYAERKGTRFAVICGEDEVRAKAFIVKQLETRESLEGIPEADLAPTIRRLMSARVEGTAGD